MNFKNIFNIFKKDKFIPGVISKDPRDERDYQLCSIQTEGVELPIEFDLRNKMSPIGHQNYGSCCAWGGTSVKEYLDNQEYHKKINLSEKFVYHFMKVESQLWNIQGDWVRSSLKAICKYGAPLLEDYPDTKEKDWETYVRKEPSKEICKKAEQYKGKTYWAVGKTLENFRQAIFQQNAPVITSMMWYKGYGKVTSDGKLPLPSEKTLGGHCISCVGWTKDKLWFRNSWSSNFGNQGYFYIPFNEFDKHEIWNAWCLTDIPKPEVITGWCAAKYLEKLSNEFKLGDKVTPTTNLNLRKEPNTDADKVKLLRPGQELEVMKGNIQGKKYKWLEVEIK